MVFGTHNSSLGTQKMLKTAENGGYGGPQGSDLGTILLNFEQQKPVGTFVEVIPFSFYRNLMRLPNRKVYESRLFRL